MNETKKLKARYTYELLEELHYWYAVNDEERALDKMYEELQPLLNILSSQSKQDIIDDIERRRKSIRESFNKSLKEGFNTYTF